MAQAGATLDQAIRSGYDQRFTASPVPAGSTVCSNRGTSVSCNWRHARTKPTRSRWVTGVEDAIPADHAVACAMGLAVTKQALLTIRGCALDRLSRTDADMAEPQMV